jgi:hypothetical protein
LSLDDFDALQKLADHAHRDSELTRRALVATNVLSLNAAQANDTLAAYFEHLGKYGFYNPSHSSGGMASTTDLMATMIAYQDPALRSLAEQDVKYREAIITGSDIWSWMLLPRELSVTGRARAVDNQMDALQTALAANPDLTESQIANITSLVPKDIRDHHSQADWARATIDSLPPDWIKQSLPRFEWRRTMVRQWVADQPYDPQGSGNPDQSHLPYTNVLDWFMNVTFGPNPIASDHKALAEGKLSDTTLAYRVGEGSLGSLGTTDFAQMVQARDRDRIARAEQS